MALGDRVQTVCHRAETMGSIKDIRPHMSTAERRAHGAEGRHLMAQLLTGRTDGTNRERQHRKKSYVSTCIKAGVRDVGGLAKSWIITITLQQSKQTL